MNATAFLNLISSLLRISLFAIGLITSTISGYTQHKIPLTGASTINACSGTVTDDGGSGNYSNNANGTITIKPATAGNFVKLTFTQVDTYDYSDVLYVYDGTSTSARLIASDYGTTSSSYQKNYYATNADGALTIRFVSNGGYSKAGFSANISCTSSIYAADMIMEYTSLTGLYANAGGSVQFNYQLRNIGGATAPAHGVGVYLSSNSTYDVSDEFIGSIGVAETMQDKGGLANTPYGAITIPVNTLPGKYYLIYIDNYNNAFVDANPANNSTSLPVTITNYKVSGNITTCNDTISDPGSNSNYYDNHNITLVINPAITGNMVKLDFLSFSTQATYDYLQIYNGNSTSATLLATYSGTNSPGTVYASNTTGALTIRFVSNFSAVSTGYKAVVSCIPVSSLPPADLIVSAMTSSVTHATNQEKITVTATCNNAGIANAGATNVGFYLSTDSAWSSNDLLLGSAAITALAQKGSKLSANTDVTLPANVATGTYYIVAYADKDKTEAESNETNNIRGLKLIIDENYKMPITGTVTHSVCSGTISDNGGSTGVYSANCNGIVVLNPGTPGNFIKLTITAYTIGYGILNIYDGTTTTSPLIGSFDNSSYAIPETVCATNTSGSLTLKFTTTAAGYAGFTANISCATAPEYADLELSAFNATPTTIEAGSTISLSTTLKNIGKLVAYTSDVNFILSTDNIIDASDKTIGTIYGYKLAAGASSPKSATPFISTNTLPGQYYIIAVADNTNKVIESSETNNIISKAITVTAPPIDLSVLTPTSNVTSAKIGDGLQLSFMVSNQGTKAVTINTYMGYYLSSNPSFELTDIYIGNTYISSIGANATKSANASITIPKTISSGNYYLLIMADYNGLVTETNELNNVSSLAITITSEVDLAVASATRSVTSTVPGNNIQLSASVGNQGTMTSVANYIGYYLSSNNTFEPTDILLGSSAISPLPTSTVVLANATVKIPTTVTEGDYYILYVADHTKMQGESNELNNVKDLPITISRITDINDYMNDASLSIYPNPTQNRIMLGNETISTEVYNSLGALVIQSNEKSIDVQHLPNGLYTVVVNYTKNRKFSHKLIKE